MPVVIPGLTDSSQSMLECMWWVWSSLSTRVHGGPGKHWLDFKEHSVLCDLPTGLPETRSLD
jgi:hypothetical protein